MTKIDFKKTLDSYKAKHNEFRIIDVPVMNYLMIDGKGDPNTSQEFVDAVQALFPFAYKLKFMSKNEMGKDYVVQPLEGLWWSEDMSTFTVARDKSAWSWTMMIMQPDWITQSMFNRVQKALEPKDIKLIDKVRFEKLDEGTVVQTLHLGSYDNEGPILEKMHNEFIPQNGYKMTKKHHEIYFSDFRKVAPDRLKTILRQPVMKL